MHGKEAHELEHDCDKRGRKRRIPRKRKKEREKQAGRQAET